MFFFFISLCSGLSFARMRSVCKGGNGHHPNQGRWKGLCPPLFLRTPNSCPRSSLMRQQSTNSPPKNKQSNKQNSIATMKRQIFMFSLCGQLSGWAPQALGPQSGVQTKDSSCHCEVHIRFCHVDYASFRTLLPLQTISHLTWQNPQCALQTTATHIMQNAGKGLKCTYSNKILMFYKKKKKIILSPNQTIYVKVPTFFFRMMYTRLTYKIIQQSAANR